MLAQVANLLAAALLMQAAPGASPAPAPAPGPATTISPVTVSPSLDKAPVTANVEMKSDQQSPWGGDFTAIWPAGAYNSGVDGHVVLNCLVDAHGLAESCTVASEKPAGKRLGEAALELRPTFKIKPATDADGKPVSAIMRIGVRFTPQTQVADQEQLMDEIYKRTHRGLDFGTLDMPSNPGKLAMRGVTMMDNPLWTDAASFDDLAAAYPAEGGGVEGYAAAHCRVERDGAKAGALRDCQILKESPANHGFGKAALALTQKFRAEPSVLAKAPNHDQVWVDIQMRLTPPGPPTAERLVTSPRWLRTIDAKVLPTLFPPEAAAKGLRDGEGIARCRVADDGSLTGCVPETADPDGLGFAEVAARVASGMKMNLWSADGAPVEGGVVRIPIHLKLPDAE
jgi:TonB family protein